MYICSVLYAVSLMKTSFCTTILVALFLFGCTSFHQKMATGVIIDASMNTLTILTASNDTFCFSTIDADKTFVVDLTIGDTATILYKSATVTDDNQTVYRATKLSTVKPASSATLLQGEWVEQVPGMPNLQQGIIISLNGIATSINMATLVYESWTQSDSTLYLSGKSIGNGQTISFTEAFKIETLTTDSLHLSNGDYKIKFSRLKK